MALIDFSRFVHELATLSGQAILPFFRSALSAQDKSRGGAFDPVTEADRAGEAVMRQLIMRTFPTHGIVGEEFGAEQANAEYVWVLDPIDGTRAFMAGLPLWGTLIGQGAAAFGMMGTPLTGARLFVRGCCAAYRRRQGGKRTRRRPTPRRCDSRGGTSPATTSPTLLAGPGRVA